MWKGPGLRADYQNPPWILFLIRMGRRFLADDPAPLVHARIKKSPRQASSLQASRKLEHRQQTQQNRKLPRQSLNRQMTMAIHWQTANRPTALNRPNQLKCPKASRPMRQKRKKGRPMQRQNQKRKRTQARDCFRGAGPVPLVPGIDVMTRN